MLNEAVDFFEYVWVFAEFYYDFKNTVTEQKFEAATVKLLFNHLKDSSKIQISHKYSFFFENLKNIEKIDKSTNSFDIKR